ncbi:hypothetical protein OF83DRAFT_1179880 [Amylostereum chailletii]|nr:hypothetical protein OF83DRAFT_1179880 [Amylostereum chailletii]
MFQDNPEDTFFTPSLLPVTWSTLTEPGKWSVIQCNEFYVAMERNMQDNGRGFSFHHIAPEAKADAEAIEGDDDTDDDNQDMQSIAAHPAAKCQGRTKDTASLKAPPTTKPPGFEVSETPARPTCRRRRKSTRTPKKKVSGKARAQAPAESSDEAVLSPPQHFASGSDDPQYRVEKRIMDYVGEASEDERDRLDRPQVWPHPCWTGLPPETVQRKPTHEVKYLRTLSSDTRFHHLINVCYSIPAR